MCGLYVAAVLVLNPGPIQQDPKPVAPAPKPEPPKTYFLKNVKAVVRPGEVQDSVNILVKNGKIELVGSGNAPADAEVLDCTGMTAYAGLIHPMMRVTVDGVSPTAPQQPAGGGPSGGVGGGGQQRPQQTQAELNAAQARRDADPFGKGNNFFSQHETSKFTQKNVLWFGSLTKSGYGIAQISASGGIIGATSSVYVLSGSDLEPTSSISNPNWIPVNFSSRGFTGGYPGSTMGAIAFVRQSLFDAQRYGRLLSTSNKLPADPGLANLSKVTSGMARPVFDDLNEVSFFQASKIANEFGLRPVFGFRQDAGAVMKHLKAIATQVMLKGVVPSKPTIGENLESVSINSIRAYFNEMQAGAELEHNGISFVYAPASTSEPLEGIRQYVRGGLSKDAALAAMTTGPAKLLGIEDEAGTLEKGKIANIVLADGDLFNSETKIAGVLIGGKKVEFKALEANRPAQKAETEQKLMAPNYQLFPRPAETTPAFRLYKNATVWTMGPKGVLKGADVLIRDGRIVDVGKGLIAPAGAETIDASGKHITPGIWDCHSHTGISGGVNESTNMVTIECRIRDVIDHKAIGIYQQLAGGTVGANQLHGSANAIGGQSSSVKWRWGLDATMFPIDGAPEGVKFALGQNPIREDPSGGGFGQPQQPVGNTLLTWRPRTRMGVEESIRRALQLGKEYNAEWEAFRSGKIAQEPRRDIQLEALGEIVSQKRLVHSHGYRADELLMLVRVVKEYGGKIATLQHVLEGYKIADEMAMEGVAGSTFADWWGYKLEAYDAIPYNAALMADRGVSVSINSDSGDHARRLNHEAAKAIRYGGVSPEKALSFVTIEPARQMGIASHTGSLEPGKDADVAIWSAEPLSIFAICLETYVDGVKRFDKADDLRQMDERLKEIAEAKKLLATAPAGNNPFDSGVTASVQAGPAVSAAGGKSTAAFGIGPIKGEPATMRYARRAVHIGGAMIHPMDGEPFVGNVLIGANGKIEAVGKGVAANGAIRVNGRGKHVYPGIIDPITGIGLNEIGQVPTSDDSSERGNFHPDYRVERAINPEWETMGVARQQGVLTVLVKPAGGGISGQAALINTEGYTWEDLAVQGGVALAWSAGGGGPNFGDNDNHDIDYDDADGHDHMAGQGRQGGGGGGAGLAQSLEGLTEQLANARDYAKKRAEATPDKPVPRDQRQEAMQLVAGGNMPVLINANSANDIKAAVAWAEKEKVRIVLYGCSGAGEIAEWLAEKQVPICLAAVYTNPRADQGWDYFYSLPARLSKAGVKFCLTTNNDKDVRQIRDQAGWAAAFGVDREEAARLVTLRTAEVLGISDRLGAIKPGMDGTVILTDGEIIETKTQVLRAWILGREVELTNRQTRLWDKYRTRPKPKA